MMVENRDSVKVRLQPSLLGRSLEMETRPEDVLADKKMVKTEITFHNKTEIKAQAQIFAGRTLVGTCTAAPGETCILPTESAKYDIFLRNGATGWEIARKLDSEAKSLTLMKQREGWYVITEG